ncbi:MAG TPA: dihydrolipoamide acetyltransferase family protein [Longimicrobiales bacterium]|nr:dihydrolipoamide acetyltransferase family protein [Longimicrobiales bacterium]
MPQMGESIAEGTVSKWLKNVGDSVDRDEPLLEISTDKVDAEIPAPAAGTIAEVVVKEGDTVEVGTIIAYIETDKNAAPSGDGGKAAPEAKGGKPAEAVAPEAEEAPAPPKAQRQGDGDDAAIAAADAPSGEGIDEEEEADEGHADETADERLKRRSTPLVRRIAAEHSIDLREVGGTGRAGRVTKQDIMSYLETREQQPAAAAGKAAAPGKAAVAAPTRPAAAGAPSGPFDADQFWRIFHTQVRHPEFPARENDRVEGMTRIRQLTADHMVRAKRIAPHVHSFIEIDFTAIDRVRASSKAKWAEQGVKVSYTGFVAWAVARVLPEFPMVNGTISGESIIYRADINLGMAVDLNPGLIVPVVRNADELTLVGVSKRINDLAVRARARKLKPDEVQGATFSITNPGVLGTMVGMPVIPEGTSAILGTGAIEKRAVVVEVDGSDSIAVRKRSYFSLGYDHRLVDGADAARFLAKLKEVLESFPETA